MLQNASLLAIVAVDTEENEPIKNEVWWVRRHFWEARCRECEPYHFQQRSTKISRKRKTPSGKPVKEVKLGICTPCGEDSMIGALIIIILMGLWVFFMALALWEVVNYKVNPDGRMLWYDGVRKCPPLFLGGMRWRPKIWTALCRSSQSGLERLKSRLKALAEINKTHNPTTRFSRCTNGFAAATRVVLI